MDDLLPEESETMQLALKRLPPKEAYDRVFRIRRAFQVGVMRSVENPIIYGRELQLTYCITPQASLSHQLLPPEQHTKPEEVCFLIHNSLLPLEK